MSRDARITIACLAAAVALLWLAWALPSACVYEEVASRPCCACGAPTGGGVGLDRIDNRAGYTVDNVRPMCGPCNVGRGKRVWQPAESPESVA